MKQLMMFEGKKKTLQEAVAEFINGFYAIDAWQYDTWYIGYSGGKDSSAVVTLLAYCLDLGILPRPKRLVVQYSDTGMEVPPLQISALAILKRLEAFGFETQVVRPEMDKRWWVYMLGRGVTLPSNGFRWCTRQLKADPMSQAMAEVLKNDGKPLLITGVREGESAMRDGRITAACSKDGGECGQGYMYVHSQEKGIADPFAPILGWRVCHVWDWLQIFAPRPQLAIRELFKDYLPGDSQVLSSGGFETGIIAQAYGGGEGNEEPLEGRTGCMECTLVTGPKDKNPKQDKMLERIVAIPKWAYLSPLKKLLDVYVELSKECNRLQRRLIRKKTGLAVFPKGPITLEARLWALERVLKIQEKVNIAACEQGMPEVFLIDAEEEARIRELIAANTWPNGWTGTEPRADEHFFAEEEQAQKMPAAEQTSLLESA